LFALNLGFALLYPAYGTVIGVVRRLKRLFLVIGGLLRETALPQSWRWFGIAADWLRRTEKLREKRYA